MLTQDEYNALVILLQRLALTQLEMIAVGVILAKIAPQAVAPMPAAAPQADESHMTGGLGA